MAFLDQWKAAKKTFEAATGQSKPSEKGSVLGISYRKSSGIEAALKALDTALVKKLVKDAAKAMDDYHKTVKTYGATLEKAGKAAKDNPAYLQAVLHLTAALNGFAREAADALEALEKDPKVPVTVAEAIGPEAVQALAEGFHAAFENSYHAMAGDDSLQYQIGMWTEAQQEPFRRAEEKGNCRTARPGQAGGNAAPRGKR